MSDRTTRRLPDLFDIALRILCAAGMAVDAFIHLRFAGDYDRIGSHLTEGTLFRVEAAVAILAVIAISSTSRRIVSALVFVIALSASAAVYSSVYVHLGAIGPFPDIYEPVWFSQKRAAAVTEAISAVAALALLIKGRAGKRTPAS